MPKTRISRTYNQIFRAGSWLHRTTRQAQCATMKHVFSFKIKNSVHTASEPAHMDKIVMRSWELAAIGCSCDNGGHFVAVVVIGSHWCQSIDISSGNR